MRSATTSLDQPKEYVKAAAVDNRSVVTGEKRPHRNVIIDDDEQQHAKALKLDVGHDVGARATFPGYGAALVPVGRRRRESLGRESLSAAAAAQRSAYDGTRPPTTDGRRQTATGPRARRPGTLVGIRASDASVNGPTQNAHVRTAGAQNVG